jgi:hypothetical protein
MENYMKLKEATISILKKAMNTDVDIISVYELVSLIDYDKYIKNSKFSYVDAIHLIIHACRISNIEMHQIMKRGWELDEYIVDKHEFDRNISMEEYDPKKDKYIRRFIDLTNSGSLNSSNMKEGPICDILNIATEFLYNYSLDLLKDYELTIKQKDTSDTQINIDHRVPDNVDKEEAKRLIQYLHDVLLSLNYRVNNIDDPENALDNLHLYENSLLFESKFEKYNYFAADTLSYLKSLLIKIQDV